MKNKLDKICEKIRDIHIDSWDFETEGREPYYNMEDLNENYFERYIAHKNDLRIVLELGGKYKIDFSVDTHQRYKYEFYPCWNYKLTILLKSKTPISFSETYEKHRNITPIAELYKYYLEEKILPHILEKKRKLEEKEEEKKRLREKNKFERKINTALCMF